MTALPEKLRDLQLAVHGRPQALLAKRSIYSLVYEAEAQHQVGLGLPIADRVFQDGDLFAALDMNLPEGYLFERILARFGKFQVTKMHLLALMGAGAIGRVAYQLPGETPLGVGAAGLVSRDDLLAGGRSEALFEELVDAFMGPGTGLAGVQPKIMVPVADKAVVPGPNVIVKAEGPRYPGLSANEWLCLEAARHAGLPVPRADLSADGKLLVLDRFDILPDGSRLGFEDIAAVMQLRVRERLSSRKYIGSYEDVAAALRLVCSEPAPALHQFFKLLVLTVLLRNGDAHLKNFAVLYDDDRVWPSPVYDQVTTVLYPYERPGGIETVDHTLALKWRRGGRSGDKSPARSYPNRAELEAFGRDVCGVHHPGAVIEHSCEAMSAALAAPHPAVPGELLERMTAVWDGARAWMRVERAGGGAGRGAPV
ncbi:type II toxin-antitoxin system HipA family toxin [Variovorax ginsengisoli]|uniref:HipA domain-containing protein n=1 Tax=Variovorax ginsengisoli TaxID=363844 RepID=A0ABT8RX88_9BURK|nr:HipA domain-containing protein [Variovorax ginsengisoli]MDN8612098.1 HipA domain-containing protein [Variovorax ginsengisoli]MDO1531268.1 HipA domain-containing protein [Variovorax ginsengisoli]